MRDHRVFRPDALRLGSREHQLHHSRHHHAQHGPYHYHGRRPQLDETPWRHFPRSRRTVHHHAARCIYAHENLWTGPVFGHRHRPCRLLPGRRFEQCNEFLGQRRCHLLRQYDDGKHAPRSAHDSGISALACRHEHRSERRRHVPQHPLRDGSPDCYRLYLQLLLRQTRRL